MVLLAPTIRSAGTLFRTLLHIVTHGLDCSSMGYYFSITSEHGLLATTRAWVTVLCSRKYGNHVDCNQYDEVARQKPHTGSIYYLEGGQMILARFELASR